MAVQTRFNPTQPNVARSFNGKTVSVFTIATIGGTVGNTVASSLANERGPNGAFQAIIRAITAYTTPVMISAIRGGDNNTFDVFFEGDFGTDNWGAANVQAFEAYLEATIRALGQNAAARAATLPTVVAGVETLSANGVDLRQSTVTRGETFQADQINFDPATGLAAGVPYVNA